MEYNFTRRFASFTDHSAFTQPSSSSLCNAGYREPGPTCNIFFDICFMRSAIAQPCIGSSARILRISRSRVPWTRSVGLLMYRLPISVTIDIHPSRSRRQVDENGFLLRAAQERIADLEANSSRRMIQIIGAYN